MERGEAVATEYFAVPVTVAKEIAERFAKTIVIVLAWEPVTGLIHTTTYGVSPDDKKYAANGGTIATQALGGDLSQARKYEDFRDRHNADLLAALKDIQQFCDDPNGSESPENLAHGLARLLPAARKAIEDAEGRTARA